MCLARKNPQQDSPDKHNCRVSSRANSAQPQSWPRTPVTRQKQALIPRLALGTGRVGRENKTGLPANIEARHKRSCPAYARATNPCDCEPTYRATIIYPDRQRERRTFNTLVEAVAWQKSEKAAYRIDRYADLRASGTVRAELDTFVDGMPSGLVRQKNGRRYAANTCSSYASDVRAHLNPKLGHIRFVDLDRREVQRLIDEMHAKGASTSTIKNALMPLRAIVRRGIQQGKIAYSPVDHLDIPTTRPPARRKSVEKAVVQQMMEVLGESTDTYFDRAAWGLFFLAGLRHSEAQGLRWGDIQFDLEEIHLRSQWNQSLKADHPLKSDAAVREVPLSTMLEEALVEYRLLIGNPGPDEYVLLDSATGVPMRQEKIRKRARRFFEARGLEFALPHAARHTFGSHIFASGTRIEDTARFMGHSDARVTLEIYRHQQREERQAAKARMDEYYSSDGS